MGTDRGERARREREPRDDIAYLPLPPLHKYGLWVGSEEGDPAETLATNNNLAKSSATLQTDSTMPRFKESRTWLLLLGVLYDKNIPERLKSKIYRAVVRPVAIYGAECWPVTKEIEKRLSVMETKMLRWTAGVTRLDRVRNESIRQRFGFTPIFKKMAKLVCGGTATSFAQKVTLSERLVLTLMCPVGGQEGDQNSGGLIRCIRT
ncbi:unnamed protein product [Heligmosomoides polygyrus]|uniref:Reverse transcriptase n=1 Tax=Heligmosomoides polygyrus TaxID=6339 RepID=A0A183F2D2_HELPZ|nr:unnamed protein product [Heligmosomoides polygyrus]